MGVPTAISLRPNKAKQKRTLVRTPVINICIRGVSIGAMKSVLIFVICCLPVVAGLAQNSKGTGVIYGTVVSQNGESGKQTSLYAEALDVGGQFPNTRSNDRGEYRFENLPWGRYTVFAEVFAENRDTGYSGDVIDDRSQPFVEISREHPEAEFRVVLPSKAGVLQIHLTNRRTGAEIPWMSVSVAPTDDLGISSYLPQQFRAKP
jgi:uncharacterized membrane protein